MYGLARNAFDMALPADLQVGVVVPTRNEAGNVRELISRLVHTLSPYKFEIIFVDDDSPDGTAEIVKLAARSEPRVRCLHRVGRRGLSSAVIEGIMTSSAEVVVVMDGDLQHDETIIPQMIEDLCRDNLDVVVGSRYTTSKTTGGLDRKRLAVSRTATKIVQNLLLGSISDPMSGFFAVRRSTFLKTVRQLSGTGFKILLDILVSSPQVLAVKEIPYRFRNRIAGESKLDVTVAAELLFFLVEKKLHGAVSAKFLMFATVGASGIIVNLAFLNLLLPMGFVLAKVISGAAAMTSNYLLNNTFTYRDCRLRGSQFLYGLLKFYAVCSLGLLAEVGVAATAIQKTDATWWVAGLAGIAVGTFWNYHATRLFAWKQS